MVNQPIDPQLEALLAQANAQDKKVQEFGGKLYLIDPNTGAAQVIASDPRYGVSAGRQPQYTVDERTGQVVEMTPGAQVGFAGIDPREKFNFEAQQAGFGNQLQLRAQALNELQNSQNNLIKLSQMEEEAKLNRASLRERGADRAEQARQANLRAAVDQYQSAMALIPQLGQLSIQESQRVQDILQNGGDFLARAFESRGGTSPLAKVTQADQINALGSALQNLRNMVNTNLQAVQAPAYGGDTSGGMDPYKAPDLTGGGGMGGGFQLPPMPTVPNFQLSPAPQPSAGGSGGGGGGGAGSGFAAPSTGPTMEDTLKGFAPIYDIINKMQGGTGPFATGSTPAVTPLPSSPWNSADEAMGASRGGAPSSSGPDWGGIWNLITGSTGKLNSPYVDQYSSPPPEYQRQKAGLIGYDGGGFTTDPAFLGNEKGAELFINPTNAPIAVVDAKTTKAAGFKTDNTKGYDEGTASWGGNHTLEARPTGGFWNSLMESMPSIDLTSSIANARGRFNSDVQNNPTDVMLSLFGGPSGGGMAKMGKGFSQEITPELVQKALQEFKLKDLAKRLAMEDRGGGDPIGFLRSQFPEQKIFDKLQMHLRELDEYGSRPDLVPTIRANIDYYRNQLPERMRSLADEMINAENQNFDYRNGQRLTQGIRGFATGTVSFPMIESSSTSYNPPRQPQQTPNTFGTYGFGTYGGSGYAAREAADRAANAHWNTPEELWRRANPNSSSPNPYQPVTQKSLIDLARENLPPAAADVLAGGVARPMTALESQAVPGQFLKTITARQLSSLTPEEVQALGTMTNTEYNAPLSYVLGRTQAQYGPSQEMRRGFLRGGL